MSRSAAAASPPPARKLRRPAGPVVARRVSGPGSEARTVDPRPRLLPTPRPLRAVAGGGAAIASRAAGLALGVSGSRAMDRLVRSRAWIVILGFGLIGIVTMQVSLLKLNAGVGRAVNVTASLERNNSALRLDISELTATDRIQRLAADKGFVMPAPVDVHYLRAGDLDRDARRAAKNMRAPDPGAGAQTPSAALPGVPDGESAVVESGLGLGPASTTTTTTTPGTAAGSGGSAPNVAPTATAQNPPAAGGASPTAGAPSTTSGGVVPPAAAP